METIVCQRLVLVISHERLMYFCLKMLMPEYILSEQLACQYTIFR